MRRVNLRWWASAALLPQTRHSIDAVYGVIRAGLERTGQPIGANDLLIAAHALALGLTVVTDNEREFSRINGLRVENWLR